MAKLAFRDTPERVEASPPTLSTRLCWSPAATARTLTPLSASTTRADRGTPSQTSTPRRCCLAQGCVNIPPTPRSLARLAAPGWPAASPWSAHRRDQGTRNHRSQTSRRDYSGWSRTSDSDRPAQR
eukprot:4643286-Prymnesium_polylepis.2